MDETRSRGCATRKLHAAYKMTTTKKGFTLIELLVVIAIIGLLSSVVLASLNTARAKARDATRLSDMQQLKLSLELYYDANSNQYPNNGHTWWGTCSGFGGKGTTGANGWIPNLAPTYIPSLPVDPKPIGAANCYLYNSDGVDYMLLAYGTVETYTVTSNKWLRPLTSSPLDFSFYTPGASGW
ncbi:MAG: gspG [Parcubacteria group bacterium]|nr:gspG [Parcubacteria group bacterium]